MPQRGHLFEGAIGQEMAIIQGNMKKNCCKLLYDKLLTYHFEKTRKNFWIRVDATAFGYSWHVRATNIAHDTPPRKPNTLE